MISGPRIGTGSGIRRVAALGAVLAVALGSVSCAKDEFEKTADGFNIEKAEEPGPDAFTPSVVSGETQNALGAGVEGELAQGAGTACDTKKFVAELQKRPDAYKEWARVLGLKQDQVPAYVDSLETVVLTKDTKVTNHGIHNGKAYARQSMLTAGTAVMVDKSAGDGPAASTTTSSSPPASGPAGGVIVTRCKCGNPLLPPGDPSKPQPTTEGTDEEPGTTTRGTTPGSTRGTSPGTTARSATTSTRGATTTRSGATTTTSASSGATTTTDG
jgi:hypothetical protein